MYRVPTTWLTYIRPRTPRSLRSGDPNVASQNGPRSRTERASRAVGTSLGARLALLLVHTKWTNATKSQLTWGLVTILEEAFALAQTGELAAAVAPDTTQIAAFGPPTDHNVPNH